MIPGIAAGQMRQATAGGDPHWANVSLLLKMDAADGFVDKSSNAFPVTVLGNTFIDTTQSQFGGASAYFDGAGDALTIPDHSAFEFGAGNFTIEFWLRSPSGSISGTQELFGKDAGLPGYTAIALAIDANRAVDILGSSEEGGRHDINATASVANVIIASTWQHVALVRNGGTLYCYVGGVLRTSIAFAGAIVNNSGPFSVGGRGAAVWAPYRGHIDEFRVTKGVARYTADFTPPTAPFPNS